MGLTTPKTVVSWHAWLARGTDVLAGPSYTYALVHLVAGSSRDLLLTQRVTWSSLLASENTSLSCLVIYARLRPRLPVPSYLMWRVCSTVYLRSCGSCVVCLPRLARQTREAASHLSPAEAAALFEGASDAESLNANRAWRDHRCVYLPSLRVFFNGLEHIPGTV